MPPSVSKPPDEESRHQGALNWAPLMPRDANLSDSQSTLILPNDLENDLHIVIPKLGQNKSIYSFEVLQIF